MKNILVTGGAGYVGAVLIPKLLKAGYHVKNIDLYLYGDHVLDAVKDDPKLKQIKGDIRNAALLEKEIPGTDAIIHLACISNDPSYELDPLLGKSINYDAFFPLVRLAKANHVKRLFLRPAPVFMGLKKL